MTIKGETFFKVRPPELALRGADRSGIAAGDWEAEVVATNTETSPRFEVPAVIVRTMRIVNPEHLVANDLAIYWFLFASARRQGMHRERHSVSLGVIAKYLGIRSLARIRDALARLSSARVRYDFNHGTRRIRKEMDLVSIAEFERDVPLRGGDMVYFALPQSVRTAALRAKGYCMIDINALARLNQKLSVMLFIKLSYLAGMHDHARPEWSVDPVKLGRELSVPACYAKLHTERAVAAAIEDIQSLGKLHRRFEFDVLAPYKAAGSEASEKFTFLVGASARRLVEVQPAQISDEAYEKVADRKELPLEKHQYPSIIRLRQAATLLRFPAVPESAWTKAASDAWRADVWGATHYGEDVVGLPAARFLELIATGGADLMLEHWVEKRDFSQYGLVRKIEEPETPVEVRVPKVPEEVIIESVEVERDIEPGYEFRTAADFDDLDYGMDVDPPPAVYPDVDDDDIDF